MTRIQCIVSIAKNVGISAVVWSMMACFVPFHALALTLTHWDWHEPRAQLIRQWTQIYTDEVRPDITIETDVVSEFWDKLAVAIAAGSPPDFMQFHNDNYSGFVGMLAPYPEELFPHDQMSDEYIMFEHAFLIDGNMYYFPAGIMTGGIFYNTELWSQAGLEEPAPTWSEFIDQAKKLTRLDSAGEIEQAGFDVIPEGHVLMTDLIYQLGGRLFKDGGVDFLSDEAVMAQELIVEMFNARLGPGGGVSISGSFQTGQVASKYNWTWFEGPMQNHKDQISYKTAQIPTFTGESVPARGRNNYEAGLAVPYNAPAEHQLEAFKFIKWLYEQDDFYIELNRILGRIPGRPELWSHPDLAQDSTFQMLGLQAPYTVYPGPLPGWYWQPLQAAWTKVFEEGVAPSIAFQQAQDVADAEWEREPAINVVEHFYVPPQ